MRKVFINTIALLTICLSSAAQFNKLEVHLEPAGTVYYLKNGSNKLLNDIGINYQHYVFPKTYIVANVQGNFKNYNDQCNECPQNYAGTLRNRQILTSLGVRYLFLEEVIETFNIFAETNFYYTGIQTNGSYVHNTAKDSLFEYNKYNGIGLGFKLGGTYQFNSPYYIGVNLGLYFGGGKINTALTSFELDDEAFEDIKVIGNESLSRTAFEIRVGYRF